MGRPLIGTEDLIDLANIIPCLLIECRLGGSRWWLAVIGLEILTLLSQHIQGVGPPGQVLGKRLELLRLPRSVELLGDRSGLLGNLFQAVGNLRRLRRVGEPVDLRRFGLELGTRLQTLLQIAGRFRGGGKLLSLAVGHLRARLRLLHRGVESGRYLADILAPAFEILVERLQILLRRFGKRRRRRIGLLLGRGRLLGGFLLLCRSRCGGIGLLRKSRLWICRLLGCHGGCLLCGCGGLLRPVEGLEWFFADRPERLFPLSVEHVFVLLSQAQGLRGLAQRLVERREGARWRRHFLR